MTVDDKNISEYIKTFGQAEAVCDSVASAADLITDVCNVQSRENVTNADRLNLAGSMANMAIH